MSRKAVVRFAAIGVSLANLILLDVWRTLFLSTTDAGFSLVAHRADYLAIICTVLLFGAAFTFAAIVASRSSSRAVREITRGLFLASIVLVAEALRRIYRVTVPRTVGAASLHGAVTVAAVAIAIVAVVALVRWRRQAAGAYARALLVVAPLCLFTLGHAAWSAMTLDDAAFDDVPPAPAPARHDARRVVVLLFDELDDDWAFAKRPAGVSLPAFDRFRAEATLAARAIAPEENTIESVPSYWTGRPVAKSIESGPRALRLIFSGTTKPVSLDSVPTLFSRVAEAGASISVVGNYLPYCRLSFARYFQHCSWIPVASAGVSGGESASLGGTIARQAESILPWSNRAGSVDRYLVTLSHAMRAVRDSSADFVYIHFPVPHAPTIYDRGRGRLSLSNASPLGYVDNLVLADRTLGELRTAMEKAGEWDRSAVIVMSDHHWRTAVGGESALNAVPFLVRMPGTNSAVAAPPSFAAIRLADLVMALATGSVRDTASLHSWMAGPN